MRIISCLVFFLLLSVAAWSQTETETADPVEAEQSLEKVESDPSTKEHPWSATLTPVVWIANTKTKISVGDRSRNLLLTASDALGNLEMAAVGRLEANNGQWGGFADFFYIRLGDEAQVGPRGNIPLSTEVENTIWQLAGTYRAIHRDNFDLDILAGVRGYSVDLDINVEPFTGPAGLLQFPGRFASTGMSFVDPIVGAKARWNLSDSWDFDLYGDVGGFGVGSDFTYRAGANFGYALNDSVSLRAGYTLMNFDYSRGSGIDEFRYRTTMYGPVLGAGFKF